MDTNSAYFSKIRKSGHFLRFSKTRSGGPLFLCDHNDVRAFKEFKYAAGSIFKCVTRKMKLVKNKKIDF